MEKRKSFKNPKLVSMTERGMSLQSRLRKSKISAIIKSKRSQATAEIWNQEIEYTYKEVLEKVDEGFWKLNTLVLCFKLIMMI